ncbi:Ran GTPase-activating protein 1 [Geodia barretti]|uniref:Ran GTPase-activating protein 1 n=1 Tax=Geodia barretti TaxID=519541 RepID=A0AA35SD07_GEOBA|nr:Ran GTPase-activating protein 1 [Geodia barretti]
MMRERKEMMMRERAKDDEKEGEEEEEEEGEGKGEEGEGEEEGEGSQGEPEEVDKVSVEEYLRDPSSENLLGLGGARAELVAGTLGVSLSGEEAGRMYVKIASCYSDSMSPELKSALEETIDAVVGPVCEAGKTALLLNEILVQVGLLKSEDKSFVPVKNIEGPVLALTHIVRQNYFPRNCRDTLISFIQKPHQGLIATRPKVLQVLYAS